MIPALPDKTHPSRWQKALREAINDPVELLNLLELPLESLAFDQPDRNAFPLRVPRSFVARMQKGDPHDPLLRQVLPLLEERHETPGFRFDAVGDLNASRAPGVLHKYANRVLLIATGQCAVHCRYCFRRHFPYGDELAARDQWREAINYLQAHPEVDEVLLSGGDPLSLATHKLRDLTTHLRALPQIKRLRLHTRQPIVLPERVDAELLDWLGGLPWPSVMVLHVNHANELAGEMPSVLARLRATGLTLLNQAVLLQGVNDSVPAQLELSHTLFDYGVLPYYLHQLDSVQGAAHFAVSDAQAIEIIELLRKKLPGYLVPRLVREFEGEASKTPLVG